MWTAVYVAVGIENAHIVEKQLKEEGFVVKVKYFAQEGEEELYKILAPEFEAEDIQIAMLELGII